VIKGTSAARSRPPARVEYWKPRQGGETNDARIINTTSARHLRHVGQTNYGRPRRHRRVSVIAAKNSAATGSRSMRSPRCAHAHDGPLRAGLPFQRRAGKFNASVAREHRPLSCGSARPKVGVPAACSTWGAADLRAEGWAAVPDCPRDRWTRTNSQGRSRSVESRGERRDERHADRMIKLSSAFDDRLDFRGRVPPYCVTAGPPLVSVKATSACALRESTRSVTHQRRLSKPHDSRPRRVASCGGIRSRR